MAHTLVTLAVAFGMLLGGLLPIVHPVSSSTARDGSPAIGMLERAEATLAEGRGPAAGYALSCTSIGALSVGCASRSHTIPASGGGIGWGRLCSFDSCPPPARGGAGMTYDPVTGYVVLFGGIKGLTAAAGSTFNDTWLFKNGAWSRLNISGPSPRLGEYMAYDYTDGYILLFGGGPYLTLNGSLYYHDTWKFQNGTWTELHPAVYPSARGLGGMVYDSADGYLLMFGGMSSQTDIHSDTWTYAGGVWHNITSSLSVAPPPLLAPVMAYDPPASEVLVFGGATPEAGYEFGQDLSVTWTFSHGVWRNVSATSGTPPDGRILASMGYDSAQGFLVLFGGWNTSTGALYGDTWLYSDGHWTIYFASPTPSQHIIGATAISTTPSAGLLFFGGIVGNYSAYWATNATWTFGPPPQNATVTVSAPTPFIVSFQIAPASCHMAYFNGTQVLSGSSLSVIPESYSVLAPTCPGYYFGSWYVSGAIEPASNTASITTVNVVGNGTLTLFYEQTPALNHPDSRYQLLPGDLAAAVSVVVLAAIALLVLRGRSRGKALR